MATAWAVPRTWVTAEIVNSSQMNSDIRDNMSWNGTDKPQCRVHNAGDTSFTSAVIANFTFDSERYDIGTMHSTVTNTDRITTPTGMAGKYLIGGHVKWAANTGGDERIIAVLLNATNYLVVDAKAPGAVNGNARNSVMTMYSLAAGDYVTLIGMQNSGGALNAVGSATAGNYSSEFWAAWVGN